MGCDIHAFAEQKRKDRWVQIKGAFLHDRGSYKTYEDTLPLGRNYELFAFLAGVRNSNDIVPISLPKGIPSDASHGYLAEVESWEGDGHSHSYFTLKELKEILPELISQEVNDKQLITRKEGDEILEVCGSTTREHFGPVGKRRIFTLWKNEATPIEEIINLLEEELDTSERTDEEMRLVFFFDN